MQRTRRDKLPGTLSVPAVSIEATVEAPARAPSAKRAPAKEARPRFDHVRQARPLLFVERVVNLGREADERLAQPLELGVVAREQLAHHPLVEGGLAERARHVGPRP